MLAVERARLMLCAIPLDVQRGESKRGWIERASTLLRISPSLGARLYHRQRKRIDVDTYERMRASLDELQERAITRQERANDIRARLGELGTAYQASRARAGDCRGAGPAGGRSMGASEGSRGAGERPTAAAGEDAQEE